ncbi:MAG: ribonuclease HI [Christensenellales bacterium]
MKQIKVYTDGACSNNPGPGGWAAILLYQGHEKEISGSEAYTTNNRMELMAAIQGLMALKEGCQVELYSDSAYLVNAFEKGWLIAWQRNGWKNSKKEPVENQDLWKLLLNTSKGHQVRYTKVKGHSDNEYNNRCDKLAKEAIRRMGQSAGQRENKDAEDEEAAGIKSQDI